MAREEAGPGNGVWAWANSAVKRGKQESKSGAWEDEGPATEREVKARSLQERLGQRLEPAVPPEVAGGACWSGLLVAKGRAGTSPGCRLRRKRGQQTRRCGKGRGLFRSGGSVTEVRLPEDGAT